MPPQRGNDPRTEQQYNQGERFAKRKGATLAGSRKLIGVPVGGAAGILGVRAVSSATRDYLLEKVPPVK